VKQVALLKGKRSRLVNYQVFVKRNGNYTATFVSDNNLKI